MSTPHKYADDMQRLLTPLLSVVASACAEKGSFTCMDAGKFARENKVTGTLINSILHKHCEVLGEGRGRAYKLKPTNGNGSHDLLSEASRAADRAAHEEVAQWRASLLGEAKTQTNLLRQLVTLWNTPQKH